VDYGSPPAREFQRGLTQWLASIIWLPHFPQLRQAMSKLGSILIVAVLVFGTNFPKAKSESAPSPREKKPGTKLDVKIEGPTEVARRWPAKYVVTVTNTGDVTAHNVEVATELGDGLFTPPCPLGPDSFTFGAIFKVGPWGDEIKPGESRRYTREIEGQSIGEWGINVTVTTRWQIKETGASQDGGGIAYPSSPADECIKETAEFHTTVKDAPWLMMDIDSINSVKLGGETLYVVTVFNDGGISDKNVVLSCELPDGVALLTARGPTNYIEKTGIDLNRQGAQKTTGTVVFEPVAELKPGADVVFRIKLITHAAGTGTFRATIHSDYLTKPLTIEKSTTVCGE
jgi:hypothetical protein